MSEWIEITKTCTMPKIGVQVLVIIKGSGITLARRWCYHMAPHVDGFDEATPTSNRLLPKEDITYWAPIPAAPTESEVTK